jgi:predicted DsbA family dithiol-disulfide isomerase
MKITIFLDTICGWCYIGHNRLFKALAEFKDKKFEVHYAPFLLNPNMPLSGMKRSDYLEKKFGSVDNAQPMYDRMTEQAALEDLNFNLNKIKITPSTILSHILIDLSKGLKEQKIIVENIFRNYFIDGHDIGNVENLITIGVKNGLNKQKIEKTFETKKNIDDILKKNQNAHSLGISGVPVIALNDKIVIQGAESTELIISKIKQNN